MFRVVSNKKLLSNFTQYTKPSVRSSFRKNDIAGLKILPKLNVSNFSTSASQQQQNNDTIKIAIRHINLLFIDGRQGAFAVSLSGLHALYNNDGSMRGRLSTLSSCMSTCARYEISFCVFQKHIQSFDNICFILFYQVLCIGYQVEVDLLMHF